MCMHAVQVPIRIEKEEVFEIVDKGEETAGMSRVEAKKVAMATSRQHASPPRSGSRGLSASRVPPPPAAAIGAETVGTPRSRP